MAADASGEGKKSIDDVQVRLGAWQQNRCSASSSSSSSSSSSAVSTTGGSGTRSSSGGGGSNSGSGSSNDGGGSGGSSNGGIISESVRLFGKDENPLKPLRQVARLKALLPVILSLGVVLAVINLGLTETSRKFRRSRERWQPRAETTVIGGPRHRILHDAEGGELTNAALPPVTHLSVTIFCAPEPFEGPTGANQRRAILSWLRAFPEVSVVLLGDHLSLHTVAAELAPHVQVDERVDVNFRNLPLFNSMVARAQAAKTNVSLLLNADIILLSNVYHAMLKVANTFHAWMLTGMRWDVDDFPFDFTLAGVSAAAVGGSPAAAAAAAVAEGISAGPSPVAAVSSAVATAAAAAAGGGGGAAGSDFPEHAALRSLPINIVSAENRTSAAEADVRRHAEREGVLHTYGGVDFWAWNNVNSNGNGNDIKHPNSNMGDDTVSVADATLFREPMPPFAYGRGRFDNWFTHEVLAAGHRAVVDGSDAATAIHAKHDLEQAQDANDTVKSRAVWTQKNARMWEALNNVHLSQKFGTNFTNQLGTALHLPWKLVTCYSIRPKGASTCLLRRWRPAVCRCEHTAFVKHTQTDTHLSADRKSWKCGSVSADKRVTVDAVPKENSAPGLPHKLDDLLEQVAPNKSAVVLTGVTREYVPLLLNLACTLRSLRAGSLIVAAYDDEAYTAAFLHGLAVYYEPAAWVAGDDGVTLRPHCTERLPCVPQQFAAMKTAALLRVARAGHAVLWTDVDVAWRVSPLPLLLPLSGGDVALSLMSEPKEPAMSLLRAPERAKGPVFDPGCLFLPSNPKAVALAEQLHNMSITRLGSTETGILMEAACGRRLERQDGTTLECVAVDGLRILPLDAKLSRRAPGRSSLLPKLWAKSDEWLVQHATTADPAAAEPGSIVYQSDGIRQEKNGGPSSSSSSSSSSSWSSSSHWEEREASPVPYRRRAADVVVREKVQALRDKGLLKYDERRMMCVHSWDRKL